MRQSGALAVLTALSFLVALALGEAALRIADPSKIGSGWGNAWEFNFVRGDYSRANQLGFRGKPIEISPDDYVVALVGDSQVECFACADRRLPEDALQQHLAHAMSRQNVKVFTLGVSGYGADQELLALKSYFAKGYRANLVLVWQTLGNDIWNDVFPSHSTQFGAGHLKPTYRLDDKGRLAGPEGPAGAYFCRFYLECIYRIQRYGSIDAWWEQFLPPAAEPLREPPAPSVPIVETTESVDHEKSPWALWLEPPSPREQYGVALTRALYEEMRSESERNGARFAIFDVNRYTEIGRAELTKFPYFAPEPQYVRFRDKLYYAGGKSAYLAASKALNGGFDFFMVDIDVPGHVVSEDDPHFNERGNDRIMSLVAEQLSRGLMSDRR